MNTIFDEISQFVIKKITNKIKFDNEELYQLEKFKKYIMCYYDKSNQIVMIKYCGYFNNFHSMKTIYCFDFEGYYFHFNINDSCSYGIPVEYLMNYSYFNFFEVEENFNQYTMINIYTFVIDNLKSMSLNLPNIKLNLFEEYEKIDEEFKQQILNKIIEFHEIYIFDDNCCKKLKNKRYEE